jgi:predicted dienelactone hydrolase
MKIEKLKAKMITNNWHDRLIALFNLSLSATLSSLAIGLTAQRSIAAEKIYLIYAPLQFSVSVKALETYALEGKIEPEFKQFAKFFKEEQLKQLRQLLVTRADLDVVAVAQFLYSPEGEVIVRKLSEIIQTQAGQGGFYGIRSALILAAADKEGLTPLNVLKKFPTSGIRIYSERGFAILDVVNQLISNTKRAIEAVETQAQLESDRDGETMYPLIEDLRRAGNIQFSKQTLTLRDITRNRIFPVDLYLPQQQANLAPLVVISHGLGSDRQTFAYLATHLASHGFAVAVPEHLGSNDKQIESLLNGFADRVTPPQELIDRPLDIKFLLDYLQNSFGKRIDTEKVGVIGQSFGGYTALALAGAKLNFERLKKDCLSSNDTSFNISTILQCLALKLPQEEQQKNLRDERVIAAMAINPLTSTIFGKEGLQDIKIPVTIVSGSNDPITPALSEQILPFTWLTTPTKYLMLMEGGTHFSTLDESASASDSIRVPPELVGADPKIAQEYIKAMGLAFFETCVTESGKYSNYLQASYAKFLSKQLMPLNFVRTLTPSQLGG